MAGGKASGFFFVVLILAIGGVGWLLYTKSAAEPIGPGTVPEPTPGDGKGPGSAEPTAPAPGPPGRPRSPKKPPLPPEPPIPATPEACLAFLKAQAGPFRAPKGVTASVPIEARTEALDALQALSEAEANPLILQALGGDGDPSDWMMAEARIHAAGLRVRQGQADGAETLKAFLKEETDFAANGAALEAARAASWLPPAEGGNVVRRLLAGDVTEYDEETLCAILQAAATLGQGASPADLEKVLQAAGSVFGEAAQGAAAGVLLRLGDSSGRKCMDAIRDDDWTWGSDFALGLAARGNSAAVPWLVEMLGVDEPSTPPAAARALGVIGGPEAIAALRKALAAEDEEIRSEAAVALALLGEKDTMAGVRAAVRAFDPDLRILAWKALAMNPDVPAKAEAVRLLGEPSPNLKDPMRESAVRERVWAAVIVCKMK